MTPRARTRGRVGEREDTAAGRVGERGSGSNDVSNMVAAERVNMTMQAPKIPLCNILQFEKGDMKGHAARTEAARFEAAVQAYDAAWQKISPGLRNSVSFQNCFTQPADAQTLAQAYCFLKGEGPEHWRNVMKFSIDETVALVKEITGLEDASDGKGHLVDVSKLFGNLTMDHREDLSQFALAAHLSRYEKLLLQSGGEKYGMSLQKLLWQLASSIMPLDLRHAFEARLQLDSEGGLPTSALKYKDLEGQIWNFKELDKRGMNRKFSCFNDASTWLRLYAKEAGDNIRRMNGMDWGVGQKRPPDTSSIIQAGNPKKRLKGDKPLCRFFANGACKKDNCAFKHELATQKGGNGAGKNKGKHRRRCFCCGRQHFVIDRDGGKRFTTLV